YSSTLRFAFTSSSSTCGARRSIACAAIGLPRNAARPLSTPLMRLPWPPASTMPVISIIGERMEGRPLRPLFRKRIPPRPAIHRRHEERERQVHLVGPLPLVRLEREARAAVAAETPVRTLRRKVIAHQLLALREAHLHALEADPGHHAGCVRGAAAPAIA